jgi:hypothetical protein
MLLLPLFPTVSQVQFGNQNIPSCFDNREFTYNTQEGNNINTAYFAPEILERGRNNLDHFSGHKGINLLRLKSKLISQLEVSEKNYPENIKTELISMVEKIIEDFILLNPEKINLRITNDDSVLIVFSLNSLKVYFEYFFDLLMELDADENKIEVGFNVYSNGSLLSNFYGSYYDCLEDFLKEFKLEKSFEEKFEKWDNKIFDRITI